MDTAPSFLGTAASLVLVIGLFLGAAWFAKRARPRSAGTNAAHLAAIAQISVGTRERVVLVEVAGQWLVLGVAPGSVRTLQTLPKPADAPALNTSPAHTAFAQVLARLGGGSAR